MALQSFAVSGGGRRKPREIDALQGRQAMLPQIIANQQRAEALDRQAALNERQQSNFEREFAQQERGQLFQQQATIARQKQAKREARVGMGLEAAKLGFGVSNRFGGKTVGGAITSAKNLFRPSTDQLTTPGGGILGKFDIGSAAGGALAGFGINKLLGTKGKVKKAAIGAGTGALLGALGGSDMFTGGISGGIGGGIGGLF